MERAQKNLVGARGFEPPASSSQTSRSVSKIKGDSQPDVKTQVVFRHGVSGTVTSAESIARSDQIIALITNGFTAGEIALQVNCDRSYVYKFAREKGLTLTRAKCGPRKAGYDQTYGKLSEQIGRDLYIYRELKEGLSYDEMALRLNMTRTQLIKAESGEHRFSLDELLRISEELSKPLPELVTERGVKVRAT